MLSSSFFHRFVFTFLFVFVAVFTSGIKAEAAEAVPSITAQELLNKVAQNQGKVVVVNIFASWCPPCRDEIPELVAIRKEFSEEQLVLIGVSLDKHMPGESKEAEPKALTSFVKEMGFNFPIFYAAQGLEMSLGITVIPQLFIYDKTGALAITYEGAMSKAELVAAINSLLK